MNDVKVTLLTRVWDWLTHRPWTPKQLRERVARSVANTLHRSWHQKPPDGPPVVGGAYHTFDLTETGLTDAGKEYYREVAAGGDEEGA